MNAADGAPLRRCSCGAPAVWLSHAVNGAEGWTITVACRRGCGMSTPHVAGDPGAAQRAANLWNDGVRG